MAVVLRSPGVPLTTGWDPDASPYWSHRADDVLSEVLSTYDDATKRWHGWRTRVEEITSLIKAEWRDVFPEDSDDLPMVANLFRDTTEDGGRLFAEQTPTIRTDPDKISQTSSRKAEKRERILLSYHNGSRLMDSPIKELIGQDLIAAGLTAIKVWPEMGKPIAERQPRLRRIDPRFVLPDVRWMPDRPSDNVIVAYTESAARIASEYPVAWFDMTTGRTADYDVRVVDFYSSRYIARVLIAKPKTLTQASGWDWQGRRIRASGEMPLYRTEARVVSLMDNDTGICPVQLAVRPNWSQEPMGQLDDSKGIVRTQNRYYRLLLDYFVRMVYGGKLAWNVQNPDERGPDVTHYALGPDAFMKAVAPDQPSFQALQLIGSLEAEARTSAVSSRAREGEVDLNKASAAFLSRAQGKLNSVVKSHQGSFAVALRNANEAALAQDEAWCDADKEITGVARGRRFRDSYRPSRDIAGDYSNRVSYGTAAGVDQNTQLIMNIQAVDRQMLSEETAMEMLPGVEDVPAEMQRIERGLLKKGLLASLADPSRPLEEKVIAWRAYQENDADIDKVVAALDEAQKAAAAQQAAVAGPGAPTGELGPGAPQEQLPNLRPLEAIRSAGRR